MSDHNIEHAENESTYPELHVKEFESEIPEHLLVGVSEETRFVMENINIQTQYIKWLCNAVIDTNLQVRRTNGRLRRVELWKDKINNWWVVSAAIVTFLGTLILIFSKVMKALQGADISIF
jgi:hypothetical protein